MDRNAVRAGMALAAVVMIGADDPSPKGYVAGRAARPIVVDGKLDDEAWALAPWTDDFVDIEGDAKPRPRFKTRVKMAWDERYFYVAAELQEPHVWGTLTAHDSVIFRDNDFEVFIDPDSDNHEYYEFEINALNTGWDLLLEKPYRDGGPAVNAWEIPGLKTAVRVDGKLNDPDGEDRGWTVELAFPWDVLKERAHKATPPVDGDHWRVNFSRVEWEHLVEGKAYKKIPDRREDNWVWSPQGAVDMHRPERWGYVQFSAKPPGQDAYRPDPAGPIRDRLMKLYQAQKAYKAGNGAFATTLEALEFRPGSGPEAPTLRITPQGYEATLGQPGDPSTTWTVRQDSRITRGQTR